MKKNIWVLLITLTFFSFTAHAFTAKKCLQWKKVCHQESICVVHDDNSSDTCFRCIKPSQYNFRSYSRAVNRTTCNLRTADYLRTMGFRCYQPNACKRFINKAVCKDICIKTAH